MRLFPTLVVDDFLEDPDYVLCLATNAEYNFTNNPTFVTGSNGRFAHRRSYIESLAYEIGLNINSIAEVELRVEETKAVEGLLVVLTL